MRIWILSRYQVSSHKVRRNTTRHHRQPCYSCCFGMVSRRGVPLGSLDLPAENSGAKRTSAGAKEQYVPHPPWHRPQIHLLWGKILRIYLYHASSSSYPSSHSSSSLVADPDLREALLTSPHYPPLNPATLYQYCRWTTHVNVFMEYRNWR